MIYQNYQEPKLWMRSWNFIFQFNMPLGSLCQGSPSKASLMIIRKWNQYFWSGKTGNRKLPHTWTILAFAVRSLWINLLEISLAINHQISLSNFRHMLYSKLTTVLLCLQFQFISLAMLSKCIFNLSYFVSLFFFSSFFH